MPGVVTDLATRCLAFTALATGLAPGRPAISGRDARARALGAAASISDFLAVVFLGVGMQGGERYADRRRPGDLALFAGADLLAALSSFATSEMPGLLPVCGVLTPRGALRGGAVS